MRREMPSTIVWVLLALLGLLVAIVVGIAASELTSRRIGLSSEPIRAGDALAPVSENTGGERRGRKREEEQAETRGPAQEEPSEQTTTPTTTVPSTTSPETTSPGTTSQETTSAESGGGDD